MVALIKISEKNFNQDLLQEELNAGSLSGGGLYWAGFEQINRRIYAPSTIHGHVFGELRFKYNPKLTQAQESTLDDILAAHDATVLSKAQTRKEADETGRQQLIETYKNWDSLTNAQKSHRTRQLFRLVARLIDSTTEI